MTDGEDDPRWPYSETELDRVVEDKLFDCIAYFTLRSGKKFPSEYLAILYGASKIADVAWPSYSAGSEDAILTGEASKYLGVR